MYGRDRIIQAVVMARWLPHCLPIDGRQLHQNTQSDTNIDHVAIEEELIIAVRQNDLHHDHREREDCKKLQLWIPQPTNDHASRYNRGPEEIPQSAKSQRTQTHPNPQNVVMGYVEVVRIQLEHIRQRHWLLKWLAEANAQERACRLGVFEIVILDNPVRIRAGIALI